MNKNTRSRHRPFKKQNSATTREPERIQKILARAGLGSRREIENLIKQGRIKINNETASLGSKITGAERIKVDNQLLRLNLEPQQTRVLIYNKPQGLMCTRKDPEGRPTVFQQHRKLVSKKWVMIGRLDFNTQGLLLFTNNGELANQLMHPSNEIEREYAVRTFGTATDEQLATLKKGVQLEDGEARFQQISDAGGDGKNHWYHVVLTQGRNRQVRRLMESQDLMVSRLIRVRFGNLCLPKGLRQNQLRELTDEEVSEFFAISKLLQLGRN